MSKILITQQEEREKTQRRKNKGVKGRGGEGKEKLSLYRAINITQRKTNTCGYYCMYCTINISYDPGTGLYQSGRRSTVVA